jgi:hypothetical protein
MFRQDCRARDWRDDDALRFTEADKACPICERTLARGVPCLECWLDR